MKVIVRDDLEIELPEVLSKIKQGDVFIHPTDTIYGLGCDATNEAAVAKIQKLKGRNGKPFSIWVPSLDWIRTNCVVNDKVETWLEKLPGPYTLILKLKYKDVIATNVNHGLDTIGIRYPDHWFGKVVEKYGTPIVTTSANKAGEAFMTKIENLDQEIEIGVSFVVYEGEKKLRPSRVVNIENEEVIQR
jgi:L-threonylcarbamoyladenylate synthase